MDSAIAESVIDMKIGSILLVEGHLLTLRTKRIADASDISIINLSYTCATEQITVLVV